MTSWDDLDTKFGFFFRQTNWKSNSQARLPAEFRTTVIDDVVK